MSIVCAWCQHVIGTKPPEDDVRVTNSICAACEAQLVSALMQEVKDHNPRLANG